MKNLVATVHYYNEIDEVLRFYLIKDDEFVGFNKLHDLVGDDYDNLNDRLLDEDLDSYHKYRHGELLFTIFFEEDSYTL